MVDSLAVVDLAAIYSAAVDLAVDLAVDSLKTELSQ